MNMAHWYLLAAHLVLSAAISDAEQAQCVDGDVCEASTTIHDDIALLQSVVHINQLPTDLKDVAAIVGQLGGPSQQQEASEVKDGSASESTIVEVIDALSTEIGSAAAAAADGAEVTVDDIAVITGKRGEETCGDCSQGDMLAANPKQKALFLQIAAKHGSYNWAGNPWTGGIVKYCFAPDIASSSKLAFEKGIEQYKKGVPCLQWKNVGLASGPPKTDSTTYKDPSYGDSCAGWAGYVCDGYSFSDELKVNCPQTCNSQGKCGEVGAVYVQSQPGGGCYSYVGMTGMATQELQLEENGCDFVGIAMHEMGHALGMAHEQSRPDRDTYVTVDFDNIPDDKENNFEEDPNGDTIRPYDVLSLMHYGTEDFASDPSKPVITIKPAGYAKYTNDTSDYYKYKPGNRIGLSQTDVDQVADMYAGTVIGGCVGATLSGETTCVDKKTDGKPYVSAYGNDCDTFRQNGWQSSFCCGVGGGWEVQSYGPKAPTTGGTTGETNGGTPGGQLAARRGGQLARRAD